MVDSFSISVIIPLYNTAILINRCLDSVFNQNCTNNLEVIVVNDGSTDDSMDVVRSYPRKLKLLSQYNQGPATARNRGIEAARGKYLAFLDADDYWLPDFLKNTIRFLEENADIVAVSVGQLHKIPGKPDTIAPAILKTNPEQYRQPAVLPDFFSFWAEHNHVCTGSVLMRTDIVKQTGGQRPELRITEDLEFWAYLATFGKWGFIPEVLHVSYGGIVTKQIGWIEKNKKRWASAPTIEVWEKRIVERLNGNISESYLGVRGCIAGYLAYSNILSNRKEIARDIIIKNSKYLHNNSLNRLLKRLSRKKILWSIICVALKTRENYRNILFKL